MTWETICVGRDDLGTPSAFAGSSNIGAIVEKFESNGVPRSSRPTLSCHPERAERDEGRGTRLRIGRTRSGGDHDVNT